MSEELMTAKEHEAMAVTAHLWNLLTGIVGFGETRSGDLNELVVHLHAIQRAIMAQAAARAYPESYRLLGRTIKGRHGEVVSGLNFGKPH